MKLNIIDLSQRDATDLTDFFYKKQNKTTDYVILRQR